MSDNGNTKLTNDAIATLRWLIMSSVFLNGVIGTGLVGPNRPAIEAEFGFTHGQFGLGFAVLQMLAAVPVVLLAGRIGRLNPFKQVSLGLAVVATGFSAICFAPGALALMAGWMLVVGGTVMSSVTNNVSMDLWPSHPRRGVTLLHSFNAGGKVAGPLVAAFCVAYGWRSSFLAAGVMTLAVLAAFVTLDKPSRLIYGHDWAGQVAKINTGVMKQLRYWHCVLPLGLIAGGEAAFVTLVPTYFQRVRHFSAGAASLMLTIHLLGLMVGRFAAAGAAKKVSNDTIINVCLVTTLFVFPAVLAGNWMVSIPALFLAGLMSSATWPTYYGQAFARLPQHGHMLAYGSFVANTVGISLCVLLSSLIADLNLTISMFVGPAVFWLFGVVYYLTGLSGPAHPGANGAKLKGY